MRSTIPTTALVALYLSLAQAASVSPDGGSISALLERIASQHHRALPHNAVPSDLKQLKPVTTIVDDKAIPTSLPSGSVVLAPKEKGDTKAAHKRMAKAIKKRAYEGEDILARAALHDEEQHRAEKRWVRATYILQDGDSNPAVPTDGSNVDLMHGSAVAAGTPTDTVVAPSFPPVKESAVPTSASESPASLTFTPASVNTPHATIAMPSFPPKPSPTPASVAVHPAVSSVASQAVPNVLALASSVQAAASAASSAASAPAAKASVKATSVASVAKAKATPISGFFHNLFHNIEDDFQKLESRLGIKKASTSAASLPAATTSAAVAGAKEKRWTWDTVIHQDGDASNTALPADGSNVNLLSDGIDVATPVNSIVTPTFPPLSASATATATPVAEVELDDASDETNAVAEAAELELASATGSAAIVAATEEPSALETVQATVEEKLAAIAKGFAEAEAATASTVAGAFSRQRREFEIAHRNTKRVEKITRRNLK